MTTNVEIAVGSPARLYFNGTPSLTTSSGLLVVNGTSVVSSPSVTLSELSAGLYVLTFTPSATGTYGIFINNTFVGKVEAVQKTTQTLLKNIEDESLGSWTWNKQTGVLTMLRQDGTTLSTFDVTETVTSASRERTS